MPTLTTRPSEVALRETTVFLTNTGLVIRVLEIVLVMILHLFSILVVYNVSLTVKVQTA